MKLPEPIGYFAWRHGHPAWEEDCVCREAVYPDDATDDRTSMPIYTADQLKGAIRDELERVELLLRHDSYAITFQTMGSYRNGLLKNVRTMKEDIK